MRIDHKIKIELNKKKRTYIVYLEKKVLLKQDIIRKSYSYTYYFIIHLLIKLGLVN